MTDIDATLAERGSRYGSSYIELAKLSQSLKRTMRATPNWPTLPPDIRESLELIQLKVARILLGDPTYEDSFVDIIGYAQLMLNGVKERNSRGISAQVGESIRD